MDICTHLVGLGRLGLVATSAELVWFQRMLVPVQDGMWYVSVHGWLFSVWTLKRQKRV